ncbi:GNAT family N-acetyltransferase [Corallincola luteus]|uniref:GNAT family N-acetyltransferase n=1 Tax=Corallincola luteus TaxID=1775177 RepID=A0ABY2AJE2_9GAMM|nr:GNAT family N-acetyltransferase [Corallincola luteus]TCI02276.1 GNAT family N-acetyltransferase [Corallincola luteus]
MKTEIRHYREQDISEILDIFEAASRVGHPFVSEEFIQQERHNVEQLYLPNADTWVVLADGNVAGFISLIGNEVGGLFVDPKFHGHGLGRALMEKAQALHGDLLVQVFKENSVGCYFYHRYGFQLVEETIFEQTGDALLKLAFSA